jgi:hypothetical protein
MTQCKLIGGPMDGEIIGAYEGVSRMAFPKTDPQQALFPAKLIFPPDGSPPYPEPQRWISVEYLRTGKNEFTFDGEYKNGLDELERRITQDP